MSLYTNPIEANVPTLHRQTGMTAADYLRSALKEIDTELGEGMARKHPDLVAAFMRCCAVDFQTAIIAQTMQEGLAQIGRAIAEAGDERS